MTLKNDRWIRRQANLFDMITPFCENLQQAGVISYGLSSYGYDARLADEFKLFRTTDTYTGIVDPKAFDLQACEDVVTDVLIMPPHSFALARSLEYFKIPRDVGCLCYNKSTYARVGLVTGVTPLEPEWEGHITIELSNTTPLPLKVYANEGIIQVMFIGADELCQVSYADRKGKYQSQTGITVAKVSGS